MSNSIRDMFISQMKNLEDMKNKTASESIKTYNKMPPVDRMRLAAKRSVRLKIRDAAVKKERISIVYTKTTTNETKRYDVCPYSYRTRRLKVGIRRMLYAWDVKDKRIKSFAIVNIKNVIPMGHKFMPKWTIEIS